MYRLTLGKRDIKSARALPVLFGGQLCPRLLAVQWATLRMLVALDVGGDGTELQRQQEAFVPDMAEGYDEDRAHVVAALKLLCSFQSPTTQHAT